jgi:hypothetical protein
MKTLLIVAAFAIVSLTAANAQTTGKFDIPFQFVAGQTVLPAGEYKVKVESGSAGMQIVHTDGKAALVLFAVPTQAKEAPATGRLEFRRNGDTYVLASVWVRHSNRGLQLPTKQVERELAKAAEGSSAIAYVNEIAPPRGQ